MINAVLSSSPDLRSALSAVSPGWKVLEDGRIRVRTTTWCHIDLRVMFFNTRICETPLDNDGVYNRGWCYTASTPVLALIHAAGAALAWDGHPDTEPEGWIKETTSRRLRPDGDPAREYEGDWR